MVHDLPGVGENLHDHVSFSLSFTTNLTDFYDNNELVAKEYLQYQTGPMSAITGLYIGGMIYTNKTTREYPDMQIATVLESPNCAPGEVGTLHSNGGRQFSISPMSLHPESRGNDISHKVLDLKEL